MILILSFFPDPTETNDWLQFTGSKLNSFNLRTDSGDGQLYHLNGKFFSKLLLHERNMLKSIFTAIFL